MQRNKASYTIAPADAGALKQRMLDWSAQFDILCFLDSNNYTSRNAEYECLLAVDAAHIVNETDAGGKDLLAALQQQHDANPDWLFGHIAYDLNNQLEPKLSSRHPVKIGFPMLSFFTPRTVCYINKPCTTLTIESFDDPAFVYKTITAQRGTIQTPLPQLQFARSIKKDTYLDTIDGLRKHIANGDCYEINFCTEGYCELVDIEPLRAFKALNNLSPAPFAAYYRLHDQYMMCASPERYLRKDGDALLSQPIKGTARRGSDHVQDDLIKQRLQNDIKERAENVMIVDLVRNDLARCCEVGSINVEELFGIYTFPQVHQMISTVTGTKRNDVPFTDAIRYSFPMGSMTGAPKYKVMQLIERYEHSRRELFSGTIGYITPSGDFDFNVIIRSLFYNASSRYLCYQTGGAITYDSNAEQEWEEMLLKAWALERVFGGI